MNAKVGQWIEVDPSEVVASVFHGAPAAEGGVLVSPSPYDIPLALRILEGDPLDPGYAVELRYLGGSERTRSQTSADVELDIGENSGRLYRLIVHGAAARKGARIHLQFLTDAIKQLRSQRKASGGRTTNYDLVDYVVRTSEGTIVAQLKESGTSAGVVASEGYLGTDQAGSSKPGRIFDESWPGYRR